MKSTTIREKIQRKKLKTFRNKLNDHLDWWDCLSSTQKYTALNHWFRYKRAMSIQGKSPKVKHIIESLKLRIKPNRHKKRDVLINKLIND